MWKNNIKVAWRSLKNQPFFTLLNTLGLAIGFAGGLLIALFIYDELSFDKSYPHFDRIHRINVDVKFGGEEQHFAEVSAPMAGAMQKDFPQIELITRFRNQHSILIKKANTEMNVKEAEATYVDPTFFDMFGFDLLFGDVKTALKEANSVVLTQSAAEKHFGLEEAVGQSLVFDNDETYIVTGVMNDMPKNSFLRNHNVFMSMQGYEDSRSNSWGSHNYPTFIKVAPATDMEAFKEPLQSMFGKYMIPWVQDFFPGMTEENFLAAGNFLNYSTIKVSDIHLHSHQNPEMSANSDVSNIYILGCIGLFLIILAGVNFMNLSTAQSLKRAKEVGIRKTLGSNSYSLIKQFLTEAGLITVMSLAFAIGIAYLALPYFNQLANKAISIPIDNPFFLASLGISALVLGIGAGFYPSVFLSKFSPLKVLKGGQNSVGGGKIRNGLVVFQFSISIFLIVSTLIVFQQLDYIQNKDLGYSKAQVLVIEDVFAMGDKVQSFKNEVKGLRNITNATISGYFPTPSYRRDNSFFQEGHLDQTDAVQMQNWFVDFDYISTLGLDIVAGRDFDAALRTDSSAIIINESAVAILGIEPEEAIGMRLSSNMDDLDNILYSTVIGVVKNFHYESLRENISALSFVIGNGSSALAVKINGGEISNSISSIENVWNTMALGQPFNYHFLDDSYNTTYEADQRLGKIFIIFTILSIFIACLGLFGLAAFNAEKRIREIGIRKVLGASIPQITYRLSKDFLKLVAISIFISLPIGWYAMNRWLQDFTYKIEIGWWVFGIAALLAITISILTVSYQSIKAAIVNPVKSLRSE